MKVGPKLQAKYPRAARFLLHAIRRHGKNAKLIEIFSDVSRLDKVRSKAAFAEGNLPEVEVDNIKDYGVTRKSKPDNVFIAHEICAAYELSQPMARDINDKMRLLEQTVMHEMVHWADLKKHGEFQSHSDNDIGAKFELRAFGRVSRTRN